MYYAYVHARPETVNVTGIFYVGKGKGKRCYDLSPRNTYHGNVVNKYGAENILIGKMECSSEAIAFDLERGLIKCLRRLGVRTTNLTDGGEGAGGYKFTIEDTEKQSRGLIEANKRPGVKEKRAASLSATWAKPDVKERWRNSLVDALATPEARELKRDAFKRGFTEDTRRKLIECSTRSNADPIIKFKVGTASRGKMWYTNYQTDEHVRITEAETRLYESFGWVRGRKWPRQ